MLARKFSILSSTLLSLNMKIAFIEDKFLKNHGMRTDVKSKIYMELGNWIYHTELI